jgi:hypothetical protein
MEKVISDKACCAEVQFDVCASEMALCLSIAAGRIPIMLRKTVQDMHCFNMAVLSPGC